MAVQQIPVKNGKKQAKAPAIDQPLVESVITATILADSQFLEPVADATTFDLNIGPDQVVTKPFADIQTTWVCGIAISAYGFTVSGSGALIVSTPNGTGRLIG